MTEGALTSTANQSRRIAAAVPVWVWLAGLVVLSTIVRTALAKRHPAPWIFPDELIYGGLASSLATTGHFALRGVQGLAGYGPGYPLLISPAYAVFHDFAHAYAAAKGINSLLMSLAAVPAYYLARRVVSQPLALFAALFAVTIPSMQYTGTIMTENAFYPAFMVCVLAFVWMLERPTATRQLVALLPIIPAFFVRAQAVLLVGALVTGILVLVLVDSHVAAERFAPRLLLRRLDAFRVTWLVLVGGGLLVLAAEVARGRSLSGALGAYQSVTSLDYTVSGVAHWFVYQLGELSLYLGFVPFAALIVVIPAAFRRSEPSRSVRIFAAISLSVVVWFTLAAGAFSSQLADLNGGVGRIEERNAFYVAPLFLIALLIWVERGLPRRWPLAGVAALLAVVLPATLPLERLANLSALSDTLAFIPLAVRVSRGHLAPSNMMLVVMALATIGAVIFMLLPKRFALLAPIAVLAYLIAWQTSIENQQHGTSLYLLQGALSGRREWVDDRVSKLNRVSALWTPQGGNPNTLVESEFFNRSIGDVYTLGGELPGEGALPQLPTSIGSGGRLLTASGAPVRTEYLLTDPSVQPVGRMVAAERGAAVYRVDGPVSLKASITGRYADGWSGPVMTYTRYGCAAGRLSATFENYPGLVKGPQRVRGSGGRGVTVVSIGPEAASRTVVVPLRARGGLCRARFTVTPTASPAEALGTPDTRVLGVHFSTLRYEPPPAAQP